MILTVRQISPAKQNDLSKISQTSSWYGWGIITFHFIQVEFFLLQNNQRGEWQVTEEKGKLESCFIFFLEMCVKRVPWRDSSHDWNVVMDGYVFLRKDKPARQGGREQLKFIECCPGADEKWESVGVAGIGGTVLGVHYRPPDQDEEVDEASTDSW